MNRQATRAKRSARSVLLPICVLIAWSLCATGCRDRQYDALDPDDRPIDDLVPTLACTLGPENTDDACSDGIDNDGDPYVDCHDFDCCTPAISVCDVCGNRAEVSFPDICTPCGDGPPCTSAEICCDGVCAIPGCNENTDCDDGEFCMDIGTCFARCEPPPLSPPAGVEKIMTYNVQQGGLDDAWQQVVKDENADIIVFIETSDWNVNKLNSLLRAFNEHFSTGAYASPNDEPPYVAHAEREPPPFGGTAIMSRYPILETMTVNRLTLDDGSPWTPIRDFTIWQLDVDGISVFVTGVHPKCCAGKDNERRRERDIEGLINWLDDNLAGQNLIVAGDFNAFSYGDQRVNHNYGDLGHGPLEMLLDENPGDEYDSFGSVAHRFYDAYRELVPEITQQDYTYRVAPYYSRIDFVLVNQGLQPRLTAPASVGAGTSSDPGSDHWTVDVHVDFSHE